ncbi:MAG TPA: 2-dehydropantoate 2-reductase, partial [Candidatus Acidoferrales bacterium]
MAKRVCIIGCGAIGSLYAAHLARVAEVWAYVRRPEHARALNERGLRVSGKRDFSVMLKAASDAKELPSSFAFGIVCTKSTQTEDAVAPVGRLFDVGALISAQNGLGNEEI